jgi:predicted ATPase/DNA-binding NarL/FixJ family response regulator
VGRSHEVATILEFLRRFDVPLLTLSGPAGIGKTRLALHVAASLRENFAGNVHIVPLVPLRDANLVAGTIAEALGLTDPSSQSLVDHLRHRRSLIVLDNFEHVVAAAPLVADLLTACPSLQVLATSRVPLRLSAERVFPVPPLTLPGAGVLPPLDQLAQTEAVALFVQRASAINPVFVLTDDNVATIVEICRTLDGLPLAIELAAARTRLLPPPVLLQRLKRRLDVLTDAPRDQPPHQRTMRDAIAWSFGLLDPIEQRLFRQLAIFAGGFSLEAAEAIVDLSQWPGSPAPGCSSAPLIFDRLSVLVMANLIALQKCGELIRFTQLETLREFGLEQLTANGELEAVQARHANYYVRLAELAESRRRSEEGVTWIEWLECEHANLRTALAWLAQNDTDQALRLATALAWFWLSRGHLSEGRAWLERVLTSRETQPAVEMRLRARAEQGLAALAAAQDDYEASELRYGEALHHFSALGDPIGVALARVGLAEVLFVRGEIPRAAAECEQSLAVFREVGDRLGAARALETLGFLALEQDDYLQSTTYLREALEISRALADGETCANLLTSLGLAAQLAGDLSEAARLIEGALLQARQRGQAARIVERLARLSSVQCETGDVELARRLAQEAVSLIDSSTREIPPWTRVVALHNLGVALRLLGEPQPAKTLQKTALDLLRGLGSPAGWTATVMDELGRATADLADLRGAMRLQMESVRLVADIGDRRAIARALEGLALTIMALGVPAKAVLFIAAARRIRAGVGAPLPPVERPTMEQALASARVGLGEAAFQQAWSAAATVPLEEIVSGALALAREIDARETKITGGPSASKTPASRFELTVREREVLALLVEGRSNPEIAATLSISQKTVRNHLTNIFSKLDVESRTAAATFALRQGLV